MTDKLDAFIEDSKKLIGKEAEKPLPVNTKVSMRACQMFATILGNRNPLFVEPYHATFSKYSCLIAPQTFLAAVRWPATDGAYVQEDYDLARFYTAADFEWFDAVRCGDSFTTELKLTDVYEKPFLNKERAAHLVSKACYWNHHKELVGTCVGTMSMVPLKRGEEMLETREIYEYSEDDVKRITKDLDSEVSRGAASIYWEEVNEGDTLTPIVKGPVGLSDIMGWRQAAYNVDYALEIGYKRALDEIGYRRMNPTTKWPYWLEDKNWDDYFSSKESGMSLPWVHGLHRVCLAEDLLVKWMGDDGFIRRLNVEILRPFFYQDTNWYKGVVTDKYKEKLGDVTYKGVDIKLEAVNQLGEKTAAGNATVYLPSRGHEVKLPIPQ